MGTDFSRWLWFQVQEIEQFGGDPPWDSYQPQLKQGFMDHLLFLWMSALGFQILSESFFFVAVANVERLLPGHFPIPFGQCFRFGIE